MDMLHVVNHIFLIQVNKRLGYSIFCFLYMFCRSVFCLFGLFRLAIRLFILPRIMNSDYLRELPFNLKKYSDSIPKKIFWFPMLLKKIFWFWWSFCHIAYCWILENVFALYATKRYKYSNSRVVRKKNSERNKKP